MNNMTLKLMNEIDQKMNELKADGKSSIFIPGNEWNAVESENFQIGHNSYSVRRNWFFEPLVEVEKTKKFGFNPKALFAFLSFSSGMKEYKRIRKGEKEKNWNRKIVKELEKVKELLIVQGYKLIQEQNGFRIVF